MKYFRFHLLRKYSDARLLKRNKARDADVGAV
jgi:hypothetical protein